MDKRPALAPPDKTRLTVLTLVWVALAMSLKVTAKLSAPLDALGDIRRQGSRLS
jgi:hypothetical protein